MRTNTQKLILVALFAALSAIGAFYKIPIPPVPFTLQNFFVIFAGLLLGARLGFASQAIYIAIGLIGVPVFAEGGGIHYIFKPTFGYLLGFAAAAFVVGLIAEKMISSKRSFISFLIPSLAGMLTVYLIGVPYMFMILNYVNKVSFSLNSAIWKGFIIFIPWDIVKVCVASWLAYKIYDRVNIIRKTKVAT